MQEPLLSPHNFTQGHLLKIQRLVTDVTPVGSHYRPEHDTLGMIVNVFWPIQAAIVVREPLWDLGIPFLSPTNFTKGHLLKTKQLFANEPSFGSPARAECDAFEVIWSVFWPVQKTFVVGEPLCDIVIPF